jgi:hypothetical protein
MAESLGSEVGDHVIAKHYQKKVLLDGPTLQTL